jgi:hypothetical protein
MSWIYPPLGSRLLLLAILPQPNGLGASRKSEGVPVAFDVIVHTRRRPVGHQAGVSF